MNGAGLGGWGWGVSGAAPLRIMGAMGAAQAAYGQAGLPAGAPAVGLVAEITQPLKSPSPPPSPSLSHLTSLSLGRGLTLSCVSSVWSPQIHKHDLKESHFNLCAELYKRHDSLCTWQTMGISFK